MQNLFKLTCPLKKENFLPVRLFIGGICSDCLDIEKTEDLKVCINEAMLLILRAKFCAVELIITKTDRVSVELYGLECGCLENLFNDENSDISISILKELIDSAKFIDKDGRIIGIILEQKIQV